MDSFMAEINRAKKINEQLSCFSEFQLRSYFVTIKDKLVNLRNWRYELFQNNFCKLFPNRKKEHLKKIIYDLVVLLLHI